MRSPRKLEGRNWAQSPRVRIVQCDVLDTDALTRAIEGCDCAYYLIHAMESGSDDFASRDRSLAQSFANASDYAGLDRIIYLGGLGELGADLSEHLRSRREVEEILSSSNASLTAFRAAMILGSGSASFEILRYLVERLPIMITPRWVRTESQPISVVDVLGYLVDCLNVPETRDTALEIGGPRVVTYRELMDDMTKHLGLARRIVIPLPVLTPTLSSHWIGLVTPVSPSIARPLAEGLRNRVVVNDPRVETLMPRETIDPSEAIKRALDKVRTNDVITRWSAAGPIPGDPDWAGGTCFTDSRDITINASAEHVFNAVCRIGGGHGWYAADTLWRIRGFMDKVVGGPGLRRGRRDPDTIEYGETLDFWRVTDIQRPERLTLLAEMKLPGSAELSFEIHPSEADQHTQRLTMTARFRPKGLLGLVYWYSVLPFHHIVFSGMLNGIKRSAEQPSDDPATD